MRGKINEQPLISLPANMHDRIIMADRLFVQARVYARLGDDRRAEELRDQAENIYNELEAELQAVEA